MHFFVNGLNSRKSGEAIVDGQRSISYAEILAHRVTIEAKLEKQGFGPGDRVLVLVKKNLESVVVSTILMDLGYIIVPVDANAPLKKVSYIASNCEPVLILYSDQIPDISDINPHLFVHINYLLSETTSASDVEIRDYCQNSETKDKEIAYCIYTSGSTGFPKGVLINKRAVLSFFDAANALLDVTPEAKCLSVAPLYFDACVVDLLHPIFRGATVYLTPELPIPHVLFNIINSYQITHICAVMPTLKVMAFAPAIDKHKFTSIRKIMTGAEIPDNRVIQKWLEVAPNCTMFNAYGPTEATCVCIAHEISRENFCLNDEVPIGVPLNNVIVQIVDESWKECAVGEEGEIIVGGPQVLDSYINNPEATDNVLVEIDGQLYYKTGDIGILDCNGEITFGGRRDDEYKIQGYRIHLNEIRMALSKIDLVSEFFVCVLKNSVGEQKISALVSTSSERSMDTIKQITDDLRHIIPKYMIPTVIGLVAEMPSSTAGTKYNKEKIIERLQENLNNGNTSFINE